MDKLNEFMATEVMGWHKPNKELFRQSCWVGIDDSDIQEYLVNWHPDTDMNQAMTCAEKFIKDTACHLEIQLFLEDDGRLAYMIDMRACLVEKINDVIMTDYIFSVPLEQAICEAIRKAMDRP